MGKNINSLWILIGFLIMLSLQYQIFMLQNADKSILETQKLELSVNQGQHEIDEGLYETDKMIIEELKMYRDLIRELHNEEINQMIEERKKENNEVEIRWIKD